MRREAIRVTITPDGRATVAVEGVRGPSCEALTEDLERALGVTSEKRRTSEYYQLSSAAELTIRKTSSN
jgi:Protein of unknown function (DUF2997)